MDRLRNIFEKRNPNVKKSEEELKYVHNQIDKIATKWARDSGLNKDINILGKKLDYTRKNKFKKFRKNMSINKLNQIYMDLIEEFSHKNNSDIWFPKAKEHLGIYVSDPDAISYLNKILNDLEMNI